MKESITLKITMKEGFTIMPGFIKVIEKSRGIESVEVLEQVKRT